MIKKEVVKQLKRKGWAGHEIERVRNIINEKRIFDKSKSTRFSNLAVYWTVLIVIIIGNFLISMMLVPFLLVLNRLALDVIIAVVGFSFGVLFNFLIVNLEHLEKKHHVIAGLLIPILALINISVMVKVAEAINSVLHFGIVRENPVIISAIYVIAFILPYLWSVFVTKKIVFSYKQEDLVEKY